MRAMLHPPPVMENEDVDCFGVSVFQRARVAFGCLASGKVWRRRARAVFVALARTERISARHFFSKLCLTSQKDRP